MREMGLASRFRTKVRLTCRGKEQKADSRMGGVLACLGAITSPCIFSSVLVAFAVAIMTMI